MPVDRYIDRLALANNEPCYGNQSINHPLTQESENALYRPIGVDYKHDLSLKKTNGSPIDMCVCILNDNARTTCRNKGNLKCSSAKSLLLGALILRIRTSRQVTGSGTFSQFLDARLGAFHLFPTIRNHWFPAGRGNSVDDAKSWFSC